VFAVWLLFITRDKRYLEKIIRNLCKSYEAPEFQPHITIYGLLNAKIGVLKGAVVESIAELKPFTVKTAELSYSDDIWKSIFVNVEFNQNLRLIYTRLNRKLGKYSYYELIPHVSLIYKKMDESDKKKIIDSIKMKKELGIDKIAILEFSEEITKWKISEVFKL